MFRNNKYYIYKSNTCMNPTINLILKGLELLDWNRQREIPAIVCQGVPWVFRRFDNVSVCIWWGYIRLVSRPVDPVEFQVAWVKSAKCSLFTRAKIAIRAKRLPTYMYHAFRLCVIFREYFHFQRPIVWSWHPNQFDIKLQPILKSFSVPEHAYRFGVYMYNCQSGCLRFHKNGNGPHQNKGVFSHLNKTPRLLGYHKDSFETVLVLTVIY